MSRQKKNDQRRYIVSLTDFCNAIKKLLDRKARYSAQKTISELVCQIITSAQ